jgi:KDO2-lipid IV(A) lauroyltransferase
MKRVISYIYYLLVAGMWNLYRLIPVSWTYRIGWGIAVGAFALCRKTKRACVAIDNVIIAGLAKTRQEAYYIARNSLGHFVGHICEALRAPRLVTHDNWREYVSVEVSPASQKVLFEEKKPYVLATGHLGAWEAAIVALTSVRPLLAVARMMDNPYIQRFLNRNNFRGGATIIPKSRGFSSSVIRQWQESNAALAILFDQHASHGAPVTFFGNPVSVYTSPARLSYKTNSPIIVGGFLRAGFKKYRMVVVGDPIYPDLSKPQDQAIQELTAECISRLEKVIAMAPDQYLWLHRRFRGIPVPEVPEK